MHFQFENIRKRNFKNQKTKNSLFGNGLASMVKPLFGIGQYMSVTVRRQSHGLILAAAETTPHNVVAATKRRDAAAVLIVDVALIVILLEGALPVGPAIVSVLRLQLFH